MKIVFVIAPVLMLLCVIAWVYKGVNVAAPSLHACAASSLAPMAEELKALIEKHVPNHTVHINLSASSWVVRRLEGGAPCNVVILADPAWMQRLVDKKHVEGSRVVSLLRNSLVVVESESGMPGPFVIADPAYVPLGKYSQQALSAGALSGDFYPPPTLLAPDARAALLLVEQGLAATGIAYGTDAAASKRVRISMRIDSALHEPIVYQAAPVSGSTLAAGERLMMLLQSDEASVLFKKYGFLASTT